MPVPRWKIDLRGSAAALAVFKTALDGSLATVTVTQVLHNWTLSNGQRVHDVYVGSTGDLDTLHTFLLGRLATLRGAGVSGRMTLHLCSHDDPAVVSCKDHAGSQYAEVVV